MSDYNNSSNHISESILIQYYKMGFKLIPICGDGVTPNVSGLLTPEEQQKSIRESKNGKVEPVNYIYNHPEFWTEDRIKREAWRFINVATTYGKTHLKDDDGKDLYLNELDIDDKEIFTRLSIVVVNGQEHYFLDDMGKETFGVLTRKTWGRRLYWLGHQQEKLIRSNDCKIGCRFEIKTDNSTGHGTLPPSRYRNDATKHYQHIGQNRIVVNDRMYGGLLKILEDCLKPKRDKDTDYNTEESTSCSRINLNDEQIDSLYQLLYPCYTTGYRDQIIYGLSGLMHKHFVAIESTTSLVQKLTIDDEEKANRLLILSSTYEKNPKEVSGYQYLLSVLENVVDGGRAYAKNILRKIVDMISLRDTDQDTITSLTEQVMTEYSLKTMRDNEEMYYYEISRGLYVRLGDSIIKEYVEILYPKIKTHVVNEIIQKIKRRTYVDRDQFDSNTDIINVQNGLLNIWTGDLKEHSPDFLSIIQFPISYNPNSKCQSILRFLGQVLHPQDVFTAMEIIGYLLHKTAEYEKAVMLYGNGDNGKSVFIKLVEAFVGSENSAMYRYKI